MADSNTPKKMPNADLMDDYHQSPNARPFGEFRNSRFYGHETFTSAGPTQDEISSEALETKHQRKKLESQESETLLEMRRLGQAILAEAGTSDEDEEDHPQDGDLDSADAESADDPLGENLVSSARKKIMNDPGLKTKNKEAL